MVDLLRSIVQFASEHGVWQASVLLIIIGYVVRDIWYARKSQIVVSTMQSAVSTLSRSHETMTGIFVQQAQLMGRQMSAHEQQGDELAKQSKIMAEWKDLLSDQQAILSSQKDSFLRMEGLIKAQNDLLELNGKCKAPNPEHMAEQVAEKVIEKSQADKGKPMLKLAK